MQHENIHAIIDQAKQQRAEYIGASIGKRPVLAALLAVGLPIVFAQAFSGPPAPVALETPAAHIQTVG